MNYEIRVSHILKDRVTQGCEVQSLTLESHQTFLKASISSLIMWGPIIYGENIVLALRLILGSNSQGLAGNPRPSEAKSNMAAMCRW